MTDATATYQPLDTSKHEFRLVHVSADEHGEISILLDVFSLDSPPEYLALSYCWTEHPPTIQITLNGLPFSIRPNLYGFLQRFSGERKTEWIYIDALCINQASVTERSSQVKIMDRIFRGARQVIAWLSAHLPIYPHITAHLDEIEEALSALHRASLSRQDLRNFVSRPKYGGHDRTIQDAYLRLYCLFASNTYWERLWIVQELVLAQDFSLWWDRLHLTSYQLSALMSTVEETFPTLKESDPNYPPENSLHLWAFRIKVPRSSVTKSSFKEIETLRHIVHMGGPGNTVLISTIFRWRRDYRSNDSPTHACSLLHAITSTAILDCSVVHDHIFSIVGLTSSIITTDYSTPILELYLRTLAETLVDLSRDTPAPEASIKDFDNPLFAFWVNLLLSLCLSPSDPLVVLTTRALGSNLGLLAMDPKSLQELEGLNALERTLWGFAHDNHFNLRLVCEMPRWNPRALEITQRFDRLRANVKFRIVNERLERKVRKDANLTEAGEGGRTMPRSAWIELSRRIAREVIEAKNRQVEERVATSKTYVPGEAEDPERPAARKNC